MIAGDPLFRDFRRWGKIQTINVTAEKQQRAIVQRSFVHLAIFNLHFAICNSLPPLESLGGTT